MQLDAVRTFVATVDAGRFQQAAVDLSVTQQAVSKRIAALEKDLGVRLFNRTPRGAELTIDGHAFLPHARDLLRAAERAAASVRPGQRPLRVDVIARRGVAGTLLHEFHRAHPDVELDVVTLLGADTAIPAVHAGAIDATFRAVTAPGTRLPDGVTAKRVVDEPLSLVTSSRHAFAKAGSVTPGQLAGHRIWMPGIVPGTEWAAYYEDLAAAFGLTIDAIGPNFGTEALFESIADSASLATFAGDFTRVVWPARFDLRRIALRDPAPVYPHSLVWRADNPHPALAKLRAHLATTRNVPDTGTRTVTDTWTPRWAA